MTALIFYFLTRLAIDPIPGVGPQLGEPVGATRVKYIELLEENTHIIYPALGVLTLLLIGLGIIQALRTEDMDAALKAELKREIIRVLRLDVLGMSVEALSKKMNQPSHKLATLLEDMAEAGLVESRTDTRRLTTWRVKGAGQS